MAGSILVSNGLGGIGHVVALAEIQIHGRRGGEAEEPDGDARSTAGPGPSTASDSGWTPRTGRHDLKLASNLASSNGFSR